MTEADLRYIFDRLDPAHYVPLAAAARDALRLGHPSFELCYQPGDATHYALVFVPVVWPVLGAPGGGTGGHAATSGSGVHPRDGRHMLVSYLQRGTSMIVGVDEYVDPSRVHPDLTDNPASALAVAVLLNEITMPGDYAWREAMLEAVAEAATPA